MLSGNLLHELLKIAGLNFQQAFLYACSLSLKHLCFFMDANKSSFITCINAQLNIVLSEQLDLLSALQISDNSLAEF